MPDVRMPAALEHVAEADEIGIDVRRRVLDGMTHPRLRGEVHHRVEALTGEQLLHRRPVGDVQFLENETVATLEARQASLLQADIVVVVEIVYPVHLVAPFDQAQGQRGADEARRAGDQYSHVNSVPLEVVNEFRITGSSSPGSGRRTPRHRNRT